MKLDKNTNILIVGLGVIGGGYARALSEAGYRVSCITKEADDVRYAMENKLALYATTEVEPELIGSAELIIFALYPTVFLDWIREHGSLIKPGTLVTDVTGVKTAIVRQIQQMLRGVEFISAHPMAGKERSGVEYSDPSVFRGANYIVTPTENNTPEAIAICKELGRILGFARISELCPEEHDEMIAFVSQLTHCIAVTLMNCTGHRNLERYTGDSFRDLTRIAKINDKMWCELFMMNRDALLKEIDDFSAALTNFRTLLADGQEEKMRALMRESCEKRMLFDKPAN